MHLTLLKKTIFVYSKYEYSKRDRFLGLMCVTPSRKKTDFCKFALHTLFWYFLTTIGKMSLKRQHWIRQVIEWYNNNLLTLNEKYFDYLLKNYTVFMYFSPTKTGLPNVDPII